MNMHGWNMAVLRYKEQQEKNTKEQKIAVLTFLIVMLFFVVLYVIM